MFFSYEGKKMNSNVPGIQEEKTRKVDFTLRLSPQLAVYARTEFREHHGC